MVLWLAPTLATAQATTADSAIISALRSDSAPFVDLQDIALRWDEGRWFNFAKVGPGPGDPGVTLFACLVRLSPQAAAPECIRVPLPGIDPEACVGMVDVTDFAVADLDGDGESEFRMLVSYTGPLPGGSSDAETDEHTRLVVLDATPRLHAAFAREVRLWSTRSAQRNLEARAAFIDVTGDGHGDIVVTGESCAPRRPGEACRPLRLEFAWSQSADTWRPRATAARR